MVGRLNQLSTFQPPAPAPMVDEAPPSKKSTRLAIGMEGGFDGGVEKVEYEESYSLLVLPEFTIIPLPDPQLPQKVWVACIVRIIVGMGLGRAWTYSITSHHNVRKTCVACNIRN